MTMMNMTHSPIGILLDYDGVVAITEDLHRQAINALLENMGLAGVSHQEYFQRFAGVGETEVMITVFREGDRDTSPAAIQDYMVRKTEFFLDIIRDEETLAPGFLDFLHSAPPHAVLGIVSGSRRNEIAANLTKYDLSDTLPILIALDDCDFGKPHPDPYLKATQKLVHHPDRPVPRKNILVVEDAPSGIESARKAELPVFAMPTTYAPRELLEAGANHILQQWSRDAWDVFQQALV
jgi:HAD superfamily hydrolase (TIGR01509 family)